MRRPQSPNTQLGRPRGDLVGSHAVVVGGSIAGLLAARALSDAYEQVTVIDRGELPLGNESRRAVPQGGQPHGLLVRGQEIIEEVLPGIGDEMVADGAATFSPIHDVRFSVSGHRLARAAFGAIGIAASRPFIEGHVRRRVRAIGNVELRPRCEARRLIATADRKRVSGVEVFGGDGAEGELDADLVVVATGRSARIPAWLEELGYARPRESTVQVDIAYATRAYRMSGVTPTDKLTLIGARPDLPRSMALFAQENDKWLLTIGGYGDHKPTADEEAYDEFLETVAPPDLLEVVRTGEQVSGIETFGFPAQRRRHYERMRHYPDGLLPIGDAICSFNPIYGQGMTVAALEAAVLARCLERGTRRLTPRYLRAAAKAADNAWQLATAADLALPFVEGPRPLSQRGIGGYVERMRERGEEDGELSAALMRTGALVDPPLRLFRPAVARRVLRRRPNPASPWPGHPPRTPLRRRALRVGGIRTPLREAGTTESSEAVVFVHGVPGSGADFEPLLSSAGRFGRAVAWDAPGFGLADKPAEFDHCIRGHARFIGDVLDELGVDRAHVVLHDFGGPWGLGWAVENPERLASATLICSGAQLGERWHLAARVWRARWVGELAMATATRSVFGAGLRRGQTRRLPGPLVDRMYKDFNRDTRRAILRLYRSVGDRKKVASDFVLSLGGLDVPALVIWGERDPYLPVSLAERQREAFPSAEVHVLDDSGHWPFVDREDRVEDLLGNFLARNLKVAAEASTA
jgi:pimeloyl-ACP methyl ester carboxylesterase/2-polyprenyl-6-methoxyphenol hydroxylase-like FAD-dependent oxidoreductase